MALEGTATSQMIAQMRTHVAAGVPDLLMEAQQRTAAMAAASLGPLSATRSGEHSASSSTAPAPAMPSIKAIAKAEAPALNAAERRQKEKEDAAEIERLKCHLHKKANKKCKFCQRHDELVSKGKEDKEALKERFTEHLRASTKAVRGGGPVSELKLLNSTTFGLPPLLQQHIIECMHFKTLMTFETLPQVIQELHEYADSLDPYLQNSVTTPSPLMCCVYRLFTMNLAPSQLQELLSYQDNAYVRCAGFVYVRFGLGPDSLWPWLEEYVLDDMELAPGKEGSEWERGTTIGEYVEALLCEDFYFQTVLPRLPMGTKRLLQAKLAVASQNRKRTSANRRYLDSYREWGTRVEVCLNDSEWCQASVIELEESASSRIKVRVRLDEGDEEVVHLGKVILTDPRANNDWNRAHRGGRDRSPDWTRERGETADELLEKRRRHEQDRAVCTSGKDYHKRPVSFKVALPMEQGNASRKQTHEDTYVKNSKPRSERDRSRSPHDRRSREETEEHKQRMSQQQQIYEKYGASKASEERKRSDIDQPEKMRLG